MKNIIFDLDGTLIDSSASILASFENAFRQLDLTPKRPLSPEVIGPPLMQTLSALAGTQDAQVLNALARQFKAHYDSEGYKQTTVFAGVDEMLEALYGADIRLYIATNKRLNPTTKIMRHLGWNKYFAEVFALDYYSPALAGKQQMIARILADERLLNHVTIYVGDRFEDGVAAEENDLAFAMVTWGYLDETVGKPPEHWQVYETTVELSKNMIHL